MVTAFRNQKYTLEEYFELERSSEERYEIWNGVVWSMAGASANHEYIVSNSIVHLRNLLGDGCRVLGSNMKVVVPDFQPYRYPDLTAFCGEPIIEKIGGMEALVNPQMIIEILSPSTEAFDRGKKFSFYRSIPSFTEYMLISTNQPSITQFSKGSDGGWSLQEAESLDSALYIPTFDIDISLSAIYRGVEFPEQKPSLFLVE